MPVLTFPHLYQVDSDGVSRPVTLEVPEVQPDLLEQAGRAGRAAAERLVRAAYLRGSR